MLKLYHPALPCEAAITLEKAVLPEGDVEAVPCSDGYQLFDKKGKGYWDKNVPPSIKTQFSGMIQESDDFSEYSWFSYSPTCLELELTRRCNQECIFCWNDSHESKKAAIGIDKVIEIVSEFRENGGQRIRIMGGEPLCYKDLFKAAEYATVKGVKALEMTTNGTLIDKETAKLVSDYFGWVNVSLHAANAVLNASLTGRTYFERVIRGIENLVEAGVTPILYVTVMPDNFSDIPDLFSLAGKLGVKYMKFSSIKNVGRGKAQDVMTEEGKKITESILREYSTIKGIELIRSDLYEQGYKEGLAGHHFYGCDAAKDLIYINCLGEVYPCHLLNVHLGNIGTQSLKDIWTSEQAFFLRKADCDAGCAFNKCNSRFICGGRCKIKHEVC